MSKISIEHFSNRFHLDLEITDKFDDDYLLNDIDEFDSMGKITTGLLIEELFGFEIEYEELNQEHTIKSLYDFCIKKL